MRSFPTSVEPVKPILRTRGFFRNSLPISSGYSVVTTFRTPGGSPTSWRILVIAKAVKGVCSAGFRTTVQPAASAGAILRVIMVAGKVHRGGAPLPKAPRALAGDPVKVPGAKRSLLFRLLKGFPVLQRNQLGQLVPPLGHQLEGLFQRARPLDGRDAGPGFEGLVGGGA